MKAIYQKNYSLFQKKFKVNPEMQTLYDLEQGRWNNNSPAVEHTSYSINQSWKQGYSSPLFHINLHDLHSAEQINHLPFVLVRDGLFLLLDFFHRFPDPKYFKPIFLIHSSLVKFVPDAWLKKVLAYDFAYLPESKVGVLEPANKSFLLKGMFNTEIFNDEKFFNLVERYAKKGKTYVALFMTDNPFIHAKWKGNEMLFHFANLISEIKGKLKKNDNVEFITYEKMYKLQDLNEFEFCDFNNKVNYYIDEYLNFFLFKNGCALGESELRKTEKFSGHFTRVTSMHGIFVHDDFSVKRPKKYESFQSMFSILAAEEFETAFSTNMFALIDECFRDEEDEISFLDLRLTNKKSIQGI